MLHPSRPLGHHEILVLLIELTVMLFTSRGLGELMRRWGQPSVVGELLAGVILGPSLFGAIAPALRARVFPPVENQTHLLQVISWLGVMLLLAVTGLETDLKLIRRQGRPALLVAATGILVPFALGLGLGWQIPASLLVNPSRRLIFSLFLATALSISAIPVIAKILLDLQLIRRDIGQITLAAGMVNDAIGWIILSVIAGLAASGTLQWGAAARTMGGTLLFLVLAFSVGPTLVEALLSWMRSQDLNDDATLTAAFVLIFAAGALTEAIGVEAMLGAFVTGMLLARSPRFGPGPRRALEKVTLAVFAPIFFAGAGLQINILQLARPTILVTFVGVLAVACAGKFLGAYIGGRWGGMGHWESLSLGAGMNARGAMEIVIAIIGMSLGILSQEMYTVIVLVAVATSLMAPPLLRWAVRRVPLTPDEQARLLKEVERSRSFVAGLQRVLLPTRGGANSQIAAQLLGHLSQAQFLEVTALAAVRDRGGKRESDLSAAPRKEAQETLQILRKELSLAPGGGFISRVVSGRSVARAILEECQNRYDLLVMGATEISRARGVLFSSVVDQVIKAAPCAVLIVKSHLTLHSEEGAPRQRISQILVPLSGSSYSARAAELAFAVAPSMGAVVTLLHVVNLSQATGMVGAPLTDMDLALSAAARIVDQQAQRGRQMGVNVVTRTVVSDDPEKEIVQLAENAGLVILGTKVREGAGRAFIGYRAEHIVSHCSCPVAVLTTP